MSKKHHVHFEATKTVKEPVVIDFRTSDGKEVTFNAHKPEKEKVKVDFMARNK
jgi:hypothetical protein